MQDLTELLHLATTHWFLLPMAALLMGTLALAPLGEQVLARGVVFIDLAVAQAAAAAALWAGAALVHPGTLTTHLLAAAGALLCSGAVVLVSSWWPSQREALIGLLYVLCASLALLGARVDPHGRERLTELLAADLLWAQLPQVAALAVCALVVMALGRALKRGKFFYPCFAIVASLAVQVLGLFLVFAALIAPALWVRAGHGRPVAWSGSLVAGAAGLAASWYFDAPSGACCVLALAFFGSASALGRRSPGA